MVAEKSVTAKRVGKQFAELVREDPDVRRLWITPSVDGFDLHVLTQPIDAEVERRIYRLGKTLHQRCPDADASIRLINPPYWNVQDERELISVAVPPESVEIPLDRK